MFMLVCSVRNKADLRLFDGTNSKARALRIKTMLGDTDMVGISWDGRICNGRGPMQILEGMTMPLRCRSGRRITHWTALDSLFVFGGGAGAGFLSSRE